MYNYIFLYFSSLLIVTIGFWIWLIYVDRLHLREKSRLVGKYIRNYILLHIDLKYQQMMERFIFSQLNTISECFAGFTNGLIFKNPTIKVVLTVDKSTQSEKTTSEIETQTDPILPEIIVKEIIKEVFIEVAKDDCNKDVGNDAIVKIAPAVIFEPKNKQKEPQPTIDEDNRIDYHTMIQDKPKKVKIRIR